jgi:DNA-binding transcriptional regulator YiaG
MSQPQFAALLNVKPPTIRAWEQGQKAPSGAASRLLEIFSMDQGLVKKLLSL